MAVEDRRIYLSWQSPADGRRYIVGRLDRTQGRYRFVYTQGVKNRRFLPVMGMSDLHRAYESETLFPIFKNRLLSERRPEYPRYIRWLGLAEGDVDELEVLARSEGRKATDSFQTPPDLTAENGRVEVCFCVHDVLQCESEAMLGGLAEGEALQLRFDSESGTDRRVALVCVGRPERRLGYLPPYLASVTGDFLRQWPDSVEVRVKKINADAPYDLKLLCLMVCDVSGLPNQQFELGEEFAPLGKIGTTARKRS